LPYRAPGRLLLPIHRLVLWQALEKGEIELRYDADEGSFSAWYFEHRLPIAPEATGDFASLVKEAGAEADTPETHPGLAFAPPRVASSQSQEGAASRRIEKHRRVPTFIASDSTPTARTGSPRPVLALHHLLERQHYKLGHWRLGPATYYRRFFDVNTRPDCVSRIPHIHRHPSLVKS